MARNTDTGHLRIGFDTEFVRAGVGADDLNAAEAIADTALRRNEVLCYTAAFRNRDTGACDTGIFNLREGEGGRRHRLTLAGFLTVLVRHALDAGIIDEAATRTRPPAERRGPTLHIDLVAHFSRADLCGFKDWNTLRKKFDSVRGTYCTTTFPVIRTAWLSTHKSVVCSVRLYDTMLLAPAGFQSLEKLGDLLGERKIEVPAERKARMDLLRQEDPTLFARYAIQDAVIAEGWLDRMEEFFHSEFGLTGPTPATLASAAVKVFEDMAKSTGIDLGQFLGGATKKSVFTALPEIQDHLSLIANSYHGGRNEAFWVGPTPVENIFDIDIRGAYTAAMAGLQMPDWSGVDVTTDLRRLAVVADAMTFARIRFRFPSNTRYPSLPVRAKDGRGLLYPLEGVTHATGPELVVALNQGVDIEVLHGLRIPFDQRDPRRPFAAFSTRIAEVRSKYRDAGKAMEKAAKEMGNATYGKTAQAVDAYRTTGTGLCARGKRVFDAREGRSKELPPSRITSPPMAAWITGMVRALCSECIDSIPAWRNVYTVTTDGWLANGTVEEVRVDGPVARAFADLREIVAGNREILERKHGARQCIVVKTRGTFTVKPMCGLEPVLARAGQRMEERFDNDHEESVVWSEVYRTRTYDLHTTRKQLISLREQWKHASDLVDITRTVRMNLEFDFKRRLVSPSDSDGMLMANTRPWRTLDECVFRPKLDTDSGSKWTAIPEETGQ